MVIEKKFYQYYFFTLILIIPISILVGPAVSLINILLISISFIILFYKNIFLPITKNRVFILLGILYLYLILNSFLSIDFEISLKRNFGFIRYIFLFLAINYIFLKFKDYDKIFKFWVLIFLIVFFDVFYEFFIGNNILGFESSNKKRIVSFFKDEQVVGAFINGFAFILIGFLFTNYEKKSQLEKILIFIFLTLLISCLIFSGERSNTLKLLIGLFIFFYFNSKINLRYKIFFVFSVICVFLVVILNSHEIRHRYNNDLVERLSDKEKREKFIYFKLYNSAFEIFKKYPVLGVGNKNYRIEACKNFSEKNSKIFCNTHPHQIYFEFLSEHGLVGSLVIISIMFYIIFKNFKIMIKQENLIQIGCFSFLIINFIPILPGGSFFADFNSNFFWLNLSFYYACNNETNIFKKIND